MPACIAPGIVQLGFDRPAADRPCRNPSPGVSQPHPALLDAFRVATSHLAGCVIVVVDDDEGLRQLFEMILGAAGAIVITTGDSVHAAQIIAFVQPDLVLLDVDMPTVDGWEVARRLSANPLTAAIPFMFVTGTGDMGGDRASDAGAVGFVAKPFDPLVLETAIDAALNGGAVLR
jgi:CheY-like chemotaxis protein